MNMLKDYASIAHAAVHSDAAFGSTAFLSLLNNTQHSFNDQKKTSTAHKYLNDSWKFRFHFIYLFPLDSDQLFTHLPVIYIKNNQYTCQPIWIKYAWMWFGSIQFNSLLELYNTHTFIYRLNSIITYSFMKLNFLTFRSIVRSSLDLFYRIRHRIYI